MTEKQMRNLDIGQQIEFKGQRYVVHNVWLSKHIVVATRSVVIPFEQCFSVKKYSDPPATLELVLSGGTYEVTVNRKVD